jgi:hypothetical protein
MCGSHCFNVRLFVRARINGKRGIHTFLCMYAPHWNVSPPPLQKKGGAEKQRDFRRLSNNLAHLDKIVGFAKNLGDTAALIYCCIDYTCRGGSDLLGGACALSMYARHCRRVRFVFFNKL